MQLWTVRVDESAWSKYTLLVLKLNPIGFCSEPRQSGLGSSASKMLLPSLRQDIWGWLVQADVGQANITAQDMAQCYPATASVRACLEDHRIAPPLEMCSAPLGLKGWVVFLTDAWKTPSLNGSKEIKPFWAPQV